MDGIVEDVTDIVLNLKKVLLVSHKADPVMLTLDVEKEGEVTAGDISPAEGIREIINRDQVILTTDRKQKFCEANDSIGWSWILSW